MSTHVNVMYAICTSVSPKINENRPTNRSLGQLILGPTAAKEGSPP